MEKVILAAAFVLFVPAAVNSQVAPSFEVASVRVSQLARRGGEGSTREAVEVTPTTLSMRNVTLRTCIRWAYDVKEFQLDAPGRLTSDRYDILAKTSDSAPRDRLRLMLQALLAERFKLALHREVKELPVFTLRVTHRGPKLQPSKSDAPGSVRPNGGVLEFHNMSMTELAERLPERPFGLDRPVIDQTALAGAFDFNMKLASNDAELKANLERRESEQDTSMFVVALRDLGLRLQPEKKRVEILVVDHADRIPVEN